SMLPLTAFVCPTLTIAGEALGLNAAPSGRALRKLPETPVPAGELLERGVEVLLGVVRPVGVREDQLGVSALPEQKIAEPLLAAGADHEVDVGHAGHRVIGGRQPLLQLLEGVQTSGVPGGFEQRVSRRVIDGEPEQELLAARRDLLEILYRAHQLGREAVAT